MSTAAEAGSGGKGGPRSPSLLARLARIEDGSILRFAFFALLAGTAGVLYVDYRELSASQADLTFVPEPVLPPASAPDPDGQPRPTVSTPQAALEAPLEIALEGGGNLHLTGTIGAGAAVRFAEEIAQRGEYVKTVVLNSPGGSVADALEMGRLIREKGLSTQVDSGTLCASSCPLVFAGGVERRAGRQAAIGVHQIYAASLSTDPAQALAAAGVAMADAQRVTAKVTRQLAESGVDPALWLHALETPPDRLYYLKPQEMEDLKLVTTWLEK